ncbi:MAG: hypothetical protein KDA44_07035 [Planctomycetales bacterium]|nr:hypothetical protein [Planctomycetales bacterium]
MSNATGLYASCLLLSLGVPLHAQTVITIPPDPVPTTVSSNTQINLLAGGTLPNDFQIGSDDGSLSDIELNLMGGAIGRRLVIQDGASLNVLSGMTEPGIFAKGGELNVSGGFIQGRVDVAEGSVVTITGGRVVPTSFGGLQLFDGEVNLEGGEISGQLTIAQGDGVFNYKGGRIGINAYFYGGKFNVFGGEFLLNGMPFEFTGDSMQFDIATGNTLSGTLLDGTTFALSALPIYPSEQIADGIVVLHKATIPSIGGLVVDSRFDPIPAGLRDGQELTLYSGSQLPDFYTLNPGSTLNVSGGNAGTGLEAVDATVNIHDGAIGSVFAAMSGSLVNVSGGEIAELYLASRSVAEFTGGIVTEKLVVSSGSQARLRNGTIHSLLLNSDSEATIVNGIVNAPATVLDGSVLTIEGGQINSSLFAHRGGTLNLKGGYTGGLLGIDAESFVNFVGTEFYLDGSRIEDLVPGESYVISDRGIVLSGVLEDGTEFQLLLGGTGREGYDIKGEIAVALTVVPEPSGLVGAMLLLGLGSCWRRCGACGWKSS